MALVKYKFQRDLKGKFLKIFQDQIASMQEADDPQSIIDTLAENMSKAVTDSVHDYLKTADVTIGPTNIEVLIPTGKSVVVPLKPAKLI